MTPNLLGNTFAIAWMAMAYSAGVLRLAPAAGHHLGHVARLGAVLAPRADPFGDLLWHLFGCYRCLGPAPWSGWAPILVLLAGMLLCPLCGVGRFPEIGPPME